MDINQFRSATEYYILFGLRIYNIQEALSASPAFLTLAPIGKNYNTISNTRYNRDISLNLIVDFVLFQAPVVLTLRGQLPKHVGRSPSTNLT